LSYTAFAVGNVKADRTTLAPNGSIRISADVTNTGDRAGAEVVQLYIGDEQSSLPRPVKELKGFERVFLKSGESRDVKFVITEDDLKFYNSELHYVYEPGEFDVMVGPNSRDVQTKSFQAK
jgi:beta-glucosidase